jgi:hypothetical protein
MGSDFTAPSFKKEGFHCPHCGVFAHQNWFDVALEGDSNDSGETLSLGTCERCSRFSLWIDGMMIYPPSADLPLPREEVPEEIRGIYLEARKILKASPRAASALLRLALQRLIAILGETEDISVNIKNLQKRGLDKKIQGALARVRMVGDDAVEPGIIDSRDDEETARGLFEILNIIVDSLIGQPRRVDEMLGKLPRRESE